MGKMILAEQGSPEWKQARAGFCTGSKMADALSLLKKGGESAARKKYKAQLIAEILTGEPQGETLDNVYAVKRGKEFEPQARLEYEIKTGSIVDVCGFVHHASIPRMGASADGFVGTDGILEFKVPLPPTYIEYYLQWLENPSFLPDEYEPQVYAELSCCEDRSFVDFQPFCPEMPPNLRSFIVRVERNPVRIAEIEDGVIEFNGQIDAIVERLTAKEMVACK